MLSICAQTYLNVRTVRTNQGGQSHWRQHREPCECITHDIVNMEMQQTLYRVGHTASKEAQADLLVNFLLLA